MRMIEQPAEERVDETLRDAIAEAAGEHGPALIFQVAAALEVTFLDQELGLAFRLSHATPYFRDKEADVVIHASIGTDIAGSGHEPGRAGQQITDQGIVQINNGRQRVE